VGHLQKDAESIKGRPRKKGNQKSHRQWNHEERSKTQVGAETPGSTGGGGGNGGRKTENKKIPRNDQEKSGKPPIRAAR